MKPLVVAAVGALQMLVLRKSWKREAFLSLGHEATTFLGSPRFCVWPIIWGRLEAPADGDGAGLVIFTECPILGANNRHLQSMLY